MEFVNQQLVSAAALVGVYSGMGYVYGLVGKLPAKQVALAWAIWEVADIAIQCVAKAYMSKQRRHDFQICALVISDIVGLLVLRQAGLIGPHVMGTALAICTLIARGANLYFTLALSVFGLENVCTLNFVTYKLFPPLTKSGKI